MVQPVEGVLNASRELLRKPVRLAEKIGSYAIGIIDDTLDVVAPTYTQEEFAEKLKKEHPFAEANCAIKTLKTAQKAQKDAMNMAESEVIVGEEQAQEVIAEKLQTAETLRNIGYAMLKRTVVKAEKDPEVSDHTTREVVFLALEAGVDPERKGFVSHEEMPVVQRTFNKFNNVTVFPKIK